MWLVENGSHDQKKASTNSLHKPFSLHLSKIWQESTNAQFKMLSSLGKYSICKTMAQYLIIWPNSNHIPVYLLFF